jgi:hypothetical protein
LDAALLQLGRVVGRDDAATEDDDVRGALRLQELDDLRHERHVRAGEKRERDDVDVLLERRFRDLLGRLAQARVDDLHPRIAERAGDDLRATVMPIEAGFRHKDADFSLGRHRGRADKLRRVQIHFLPPLGAEAPPGSRISFK